MTETKKRTGRNGLYKFDNSCRVSYPTELYLKMRKVASQKGMSIHELQRHSMMWYLDHLDKVAEQKRIETE